MDLGELKKQMNPDKMDENLKLKQRNQLLEKDLLKQNEYIKKLVSKLKKYQSEVK